VIGVPLVGEGLRNSGKEAGTVTLWISRGGAVSELT
jgi:hypothetical protein